MKVAFIGAGNIAPFHLQAFRYLGVEISAICTRSEKGAQFAAQHGIPRAFQSVPKMLLEIEPDAVCVLTQPSAYGEILNYLKPLNIPVFLEKPIGYTVKEAESLKPHLPVKVFIGQNRRFYGGVQMIRQKIQSAQGIFAQLFLPERAKDFSHRDQNTRDHWHMLNGIHGVDLLTHLVGPPKRIIGRDGWGTLEYTKLSRFNAAFYEAQNETRVMFMSNLDSTGGWRLHFFLQQEEIIIAPMEECRIKRMTGVEVVPVSSDDQAGKPGFIAQARCFLNGVQGKVDPMWVNFDDALTSMKTMEILYGEGSRDKS